MQRITSACLIRDRRIHRNGKLVFDGHAAASTAEAAGGLTGFLLAAYQHAGAVYPKFYKMDQLCKLGWLAAEHLLAGGFRGGPYDPGEVAVVLSNANASLDTDYRYFASVAEVPSPALFVYTLPNIVTGELSIRHKWKGENAFFIFEAFDAAFTAGYVRDLFDRDRARACVCGWVDVLDEAHAAALFLVERDVDGLPFTADKMIDIMNMQNAGNAGNIE